MNKVASGFNLLLEDAKEMYIVDGEEVHDGQSFNLLLEDAKETIISKDGFAIGKFQSLIRGRKSVIRGSHGAMKHSVSISY